MSDRPHSGEILFIGEPTHTERPQHVKMTKTKTYFDLLETCRRPGCPVCRMEEAADKAFLESVLYEQVTDPTSRDRMRASLGFCHEHAWLIADEMRGNALGLAIVYEDVLREVLRQLEQFPAGDRPHPRLSAKPCPACEQRKTWRRMILDVLAEHARDPEMTTAFAQSTGLCLPHLRLALETFKDPAFREVLLKTHLQKYESLRAELGEFIRKNDYRFTGEEPGSERDSWRRVVGTMTGNKPGG